MTYAPIELDAALQQRVGEIEFFSATYRLFKIDSLEPNCEDYGQSVRYLGTCAAEPHAFILDSHHKMEKNKMFPVCGNTFDMLHKTRFRKHFEFFSTEPRQHFGIYPGCGTSMPFVSSPSSSSSSSSSSCC